MGGRDKEGKEVKLCYTTLEHRLDGKLKTFLEAKVSEAPVKWREEDQVLSRGADGDTLRGLKVGGLEK